MSDPDQRLLVATQNRMLADDMEREAAKMRREADETKPVSESWLGGDDVFTLQAAVEHLRSCAPDEDDMDGRARRADAAFRIASKLERMVARRRS